MGGGHHTTDRVLTGVKGEQPALLGRRIWQVGGQWCSQLCAGLLGGRLSCLLACFVRAGSWQAGVQWQHLAPCRLMLEVMPVHHHVWCHHALRTFFRLHCMATSAAAAAGCCFHLFVSRYHRPGGLSWMECYLRIDKAQPKDLKETFLFVSAWSHKFVLLSTWCLVHKPFSQSLQPCHHRTAPCTARPQLVTSSLCVFAADYVHTALSP